MDFTRQSDFEVRFEWGLEGIQQLANTSTVAIVVDVLSFSSCVEIACSRGAVVLPYRFKDASAETFAKGNNARLASNRQGPGWSLSPQSLLSIEAGTRLVLPSPNGSTLSLACTAPVVLAGCLRNAKAVAAFAATQTGPITVIAAGERWNNGNLRPAIEDLLGAGAIIQQLNQSKSPEAQMTEAAFSWSQSNLLEILQTCVSGIELISKGFPADVELAAQLDSSGCVPRLYNGAYRDFRP